MNIIQLSKQTTGGAGVANAINQLPSEWLTSTFAPGFPVQPFTRPEEVEVPREIDYPIAVNASLQPRTGYGLMPFAALAAAYENITEVRMPVQIIMRELNSFHPRLVDREGNELFEHPYHWLTVAPDRQTPFDVWMTRFLKSSYIFDAGAVYIDDREGELFGLHYIDGSTLFIMVDEHGRVPQPGDVSDSESVTKRYLAKAQEWASQGKTLPTKTPAYAQVIKGTPFGWYSLDEIWYKPRSRRFNAPYGESFIEQAWGWVLIIANITAFELAHYREGNMPEGWFESPSDWSLERLAAFELVNNARMSGGPAERMRSRFYPAGFKWHETKKAEFPQKLYEQARDNILLTIGLPPSEVGKVPGQGLGGTGFAEAMQSALFRNGLMPPKTYIEGMFNEILGRFGVDDAQFELALPTASVDPDKQREGVITSFQTGLLSMNDALAQLGQKKVPGGDVHIVVQGGTVIVLEDYLAGKRDPPVGADAAQQTNQVAPVPTDEVPQATRTPDDFATASEILSTGSLGSGGKFHSVAKHNGNGHELAHPRQLAGRFAPKGKFDAAAALALLGDMDIGLPPDFDVSRFVSDFEQEQAEHPTLASDPRNIAQIVLDHWAGSAERTSVAKRDITDHNGSMVAVFIPDEVAAKLRTIAEGLGLPESARLELAENMHVTLAFLPDFDKAAGATVLKCVKEAAAKCNKLTGKVQGYGVFNGQEGEGVLYASLDVVELAALRTDICKALDEASVPYGKDHGFVPHITLAYFPEDWQLPEGFAVPDMPCEIDAVAFSMGERRYLCACKADGANGNPTAPDLSGYTKALPAADMPTRLRDGIIKLDWPELRKHCGVCLEDEEYYQAPVARETEFAFPSDHHINDVEIVAMIPEGLPPKPALWKPEGGELETVWGRIGGKQYPREEAAYLLDRSLGFFLVPVAYVATVGDEEGAVLYYTAGAGEPKPAEEYALQWIERAGVLDYAMSQLDRHDGHNYLTHPDDPERMVLIDNGLAFPSDPKQFCQSNFCEAQYGKPLSAGILRQMQLAYNDHATWKDIAALVGSEAADKARVCLQHMIDDKAILQVHAEAASESS
jgi:2'-5' RNA ligase